MRRRAATAAVVALGAVPAVVAAAHAAAPSATAADPAGDVAGSSPDLTRFTIARGADGRLAATLTLAAAWQPADLRAASGPPGSLCAKVWAASAPPDQPPDYLVCATADAQGQLRGSVLQERANKLPVRVAAAAVSRPSSRVVRLRFAQSAVGSPARPRFAAEATAPGCVVLTCVDTAPDAPKALALRLRAS